MQTLAERLAGWAASTTWQDMPREVQDIARLHVLDVVGVMLAARSSDVADASARAASATDGAAAAGGVKPLARSEALSLAGAAFVNGVMASVQEFDDTHIESFVHSTIAPFSAALAFCQQQRLPGSSLLQAVVLGSELSIRLGLVSPVRLHSHGIHPTAVMGTFGAIYALGNLQGMTPAQITSATGHGASMCSGLMASWEDGSSTKTLHVGMAAANAVRATALAREGIAGPVSVFDGRYGWFRTHLPAVAPGDFRFEQAAASLGERWNILDVASKPYPSAFTIHPYVDALLMLKAAHGLKAEDITRIRCGIAKSSVATLCEPLAEKLRPRTTWQGRISLQHSMAEAFVTGGLDKHSYSPAALADPRIQALADKVVYEVDPHEVINAKKSGARVWVETADGQVHAQVIDSVRGTRDNPITTDDYLRKFRSNAEGVIPAGQINEAVDALMALDSAADVSAVFNRLSA